MTIDWSQLSKATGYIQQLFAALGIEITNRGLDVQNSIVIAEDIGAIIALIAPELAPEVGLAEMVLKLASVAIPAIESGAITPGDGPSVAAGPQPIGKIGAGR